MNNRAPRKHFSWTSPGPVASENEHALIFFQTSPKKISHQGFTSKQIGWYSYHLKTIFRNPRRNVELNQMLTI